LLQPTSPIRDLIFVTTKLQEFFESPYELAMPIKPIGKKQGFVTSKVSSESEYIQFTNPPTQYEECGNVFFFKTTDSFLKLSNKNMNQKIMPLIIKSSLCQIDIDTYDEMKLFEYVQKGLEE
jgi:hypothetical protein